LLNWDSEKEDNHQKIIKMKEVALIEARAEGEKLIQAAKNA